MSVYFMTAADGPSPIKIGHSEDVEGRRRQLESTYGRPMIVLATLPGGREEETAIHERFAAYRIGRTEQFRPVPEIMEFIGRPLLVTANPETIEAIKPRYRTIMIRMSLTYYEWLKEVARNDRLSIPDFLDRAVVGLAKKGGFEDPPPDRLP